jgi:hypothetical protein
MTTANLEMHSGNTKYIRITVKNTDLTAYDLTGKTVDFTIKLKKDDVAPLFTKSIGSGVVLTNAAGGILTVTISPDDTSALDEESYYHETKVTNGAEVVTILDGRLKIKKSLFV